MVNTIDSLKLDVYSQIGMNCEIWSITGDGGEQPTTFKDSAVAKYYAHLWQTHESEKRKQNDFKALTKKG